MNDRTVINKAALQQPIPVLLCQDSLNGQQQLAQAIALYDTVFTQFVRERNTRHPAVAKYLA